MMVTRQHVTDLGLGYRALASEIESLEFEEGAADFVITDPPYSENVEQDARRGAKTDRAISRPMVFDFHPATTERRARWALQIARVTRKMAAVFCDHESSADWRRHLERAGMQYLRTGIWVRCWDKELTADRPSNSGAPKFQGDYPAAGHECIVLARMDRRARWRGGGHPMVYTDPVVRGEIRAHPTQKPVGLMVRLVRDLAAPGETIVDPFVGSGSTLVAAKRLGCPAVGFDVEQKWATYAERRAAAAKPGLQD